MRIGVVGATGQVGTVMRRLLAVTALLLVALCSTAAADPVTFGAESSQVGLLSISVICTVVLQASVGWRPLLKTF